MRKWGHMIIILISLFVILFFTRLILPSQIDDVSSSIPCSKELLEEVDIYYVIPEFNNTPNNKEWCNKILSKEKKLAMHGVSHSYKEFQVYRNEDYVQNGIDKFEECFGFTPSKFKAPNLGWTKENNWMKNNLKIHVYINQLTHKVYHCSDTGKFPNWLIKIF